MLKKIFKVDINLLKEVFKQYSITISLSILTYVYLLFIWNDADNLQKLVPFLSTTLFIPLWAKVEEYKEKNLKKSGVLFFLHFLLTLFFWQFNGEFQLFVSFSTLLILASTILFFISKKEKNSNETNYAQKSLSFFAITTIYSFVIFLSLTFFIFLIKELFKIDLDYDYSLKIFFFVIYGLSPIIYLLLWKDNNDSFYHKLTILFQKYIVFPLLLIFLAIIYTYIVRILVIREFPKKVVPYMLLSYLYISSLFYYLSKDLKINRITKTFRSINFFLYLPLLPLLYYSILIRINQYGFTEFRHIVLSNTIYFTMITAYFLFSKKKDLSLLPKLYIVLTLLIAIGPLSSNYITYHSQKSRFETFLEEVNGNWNKDNTYKLSAFIDHFYKRKQFGELNPDYANIDSREDFAQKLGANYSYDYLYPNNYTYYYGNPIYNISSYEYSFNLDSLSTDNKYILENNLEIKYEYLVENEQILYIFYNGEKISINFNQIANEIIRDYLDKTYNNEVLDLFKKVQINDLEILISFNSISKYTSEDYVYFMGTFIAIKKI